MAEAKEKEAASPSWLTSASLGVELLKNAAVLVVGVYLAFSARSAIGTVMGNVQSGKQSLTDLEVGDKTLKLKLTEVREHLTVALNDAATSAVRAINL